MRFGLYLAYLLGMLLLVTPQVQATTIDAPPSSPVPYQAWADSSLVPTPPGTIDVVEQACAPKPACTSAGGPVFVGAGEILGGGWDQPWPRLHELFMHELGHQFDFKVLTDADRAAFSDLIGDPGVPWHTEGGNPPGEQFAEAFAYCSLHRALPRGQSRLLLGYTYEPNREVFRLACRLIRDVYWY
jgi:hypothetical protein